MSVRNKHQDATETTAAAAAESSRVVATPELATGVSAGSSTPVMPPNLPLTELAAAAFRRWLVSKGCGNWHVFHSGDDELYDVEQSLDRLLDEGEAQPTWEPAPPLTGPVGMAEQVLVRNDDSDAFRPGRLFQPGFLMVGQFRVALARWYWIDPDYNAPDTLWLAACESEEAYDELRDRVKELRHEGNVAVWQIVRGPASHDGPRIKRKRSAGKELVISDELRQRLDRDLLGFFKPGVKSLYKKLDVPYRRGVLLHGPPGNGKTSLLRMVGGRLPKVPFMLLRPDRQISGNALRQIIDRWQRQAPAALVIEDLNWLLEQVDVSQFLNLIDGVERQDAKGLLLVATTNYPEKLDPAVNNRPGRFDVVIELPNPDLALRREFFEKNLAKDDQLSQSARADAAKNSDGLSFAHLREILRLSGLLAIEDNRRERTDADLKKAVSLVREGNDRARRGFPKPPEIPFGLAMGRT
ncbi:MAG: ATP-binding protein [Planctomycetota bacterium]